MADKTTTGLRFRGLDATFAGGLMMLSGASGTTSKIIFKRPDNASEATFIRTNAYWNEYGAHANEGHKFIDSSSNILLQLNGGNSTSGNGALSATFAGTVSAEDNIHLTDAGTVRAKLLLNASDRDNVELRAESLGSTMKFFTVGTQALELDASQDATFAGKVTLNSLQSFNLTNRYQKWSFELPSFTHNTANLAADIQLPNEYINGLLELRLQSGYSHQNAVGEAYFKWVIGLNPSNSVWYTPRLIERHITDQAASQIFVDDPIWDSSASKYRIRVYHKVSSGNQWEGTLTLTSQGGGTIDGDISITGLLTSTSTTNTHPIGKYYFDPVRIKTAAYHTANTAADELVIGDGTGHHGITIHTGTTHQGSIYFADDLDAEAAGDNPVGNRDGVFRYDQNSQHFQFRTAGNQQALTVRHNLSTFEGILDVNGQSNSNFYALELERSGSSQTTPDIWGTNNVFVIGTSSSNDVLSLSNSDATFEGAVTVGNKTVTSSTTNWEQMLVVKGKNNYSDGTNWYGTYGQILLHSDTNMTGSARRFLITNALGNNTFAIVRSVDGNTNPVVNSTAGGYTPNSGTVDFAINNSGNVGIGQAQPSYKLHVVGTSLVTGNATFQGYINLSNGYGSTKGLYLNGNPAVWREDADNLRLPLPVARFNEIVTVGNQNSNNNGSGADGRYATGILDLSNGGTPSYFRIATNIPFNSSGADFTVTVEGFRYGSRKPVSLQICWHIYPANTPYNHCVISNGGWSPVVKIAKNNTTDNLEILLESPGYWPKMYVKSLHSSNYEVGAYAKGWTWANGDFSSGYSVVTTVPYQSLSLGNGGINNGGNINGDTITGTSIVKSGGTSSQYLMADGSVSTTSFNGGTITNSILIDYTGNDGNNNDAGLKVMNDASDWGIYVRKDSNANYGIRIDSGGGDAFNIYSTTGGSTKVFGVNGSNGDTTIAGNVTVDGSLIGKSDHTTELGSYASGQIKRIRMSQGGEVIFGDSSTANPIGVTEGVWNSFGDQDYMSIYSRNSFRIYGYGTSATPQLHTFVGRHTSSGGSFLGVGNITSPNGTYGTSNTVLTVKGTTSGGEGIIQIVGLGNNATDNVGCLAFHSYAEADPMASIRSIRGNADDKGTLSFNTNNGGTEAERMRITNTGRVGVATTSPISRFHIFTGSGTSNSETLVIDRNSASDYTGVSFATAGTVDWSVGMNSANNFEVFEDGQDAKTRLTIATGGNVGIGTASPAYKVEINDDTANGRAIQAVQSATSGTNYGFQGGAYGVGATKNIGLHITAEGATTNVAGVFIGAVGIGTASPTSYNAAANHLVVAGTGNTGLTIASGTSNDGNIGFADGTSGADAYRGILRYNHDTDSMQFFANATERMRILSGGYVAIGQTTAYAPTGGGSTMLTVTRTANEETNLVVSNQANHASAEARLIMATYGHDFIISGTSSLGGSKLLFHRAAQKLLEFNSDNEAHFTGDVAIPSDQQLQIGGSIAAGDLKIYRDTSSNTNLIVNKTGALKISQQQDDGNIVFTNDDGNGGSFDYFSLDGGSAEYDSGATTAAYTVWQDNSRIALGSSKDAMIWHNGADTWFDNYTGNINIRNRQDDGDIKFYSDNMSGGHAEYIRIDGGIGETVFSRNTQHTDQVHAQFGTHNDLRIYHDGSNSYVETDTGSAGDLYVKAQGTNHDLYLQAADDIFIRPQGGENGIKVHGNGGVELYRNNDLRLQTTTSGVTVKGKITMDPDPLSGASYGFEVKGDINSKLSLSTLGTVQNFTKGASDETSGEGIFSYKNFRDYPSADDNSKVLNIAATSGKWGSTSHAASYIRFSTAEADTDTTECLLLKPDNSAEFAGNVVVAQDKQLQASRNTTTSGVAAAAASFIDHTTGSGNRCTVAMEANGYQGSRHIEFYGGSNLHGSISAGYNATGFNTSSDYRLKENVNDLSDALTKVDLLLPKTFTWKGGDENRVVQGFLAHEAQEVVPESVTGTKDETDENGKAVYQGIDQAKLVPLLTAAIKELKAQNEDLLNRVKALESK